MDTLNRQNPYTLETTNQLTRNYKRVRIGDRTQRNLTAFPVMRNSITPENHFKAEKEVGRTLPEKNTEDNSAKESVPQMLLLPPQPVGYLKPPKYDYF